MKCAGAGPAMTLILTRCAASGSKLKSCSERSAIATGPLTISVQMVVVAQAPTGINVLVKVSTGLSVFPADFEVFTNRMEKGPRVMKWIQIGLAIWLAPITLAQADTFDACAACAASILNTPKSVTGACSTACSGWYGTPRYREWAEKWMLNHPAPKSIYQQWMETHTPRDQLITPPICEIAIVKEVFPAGEECRSGEEAQGRHGDTADGDYLSTAATKCANWRCKSVPVGLREKGCKALAFGVAARIEARGA